MKCAGCGVDAKNIYIYNKKYYCEECCYKQKRKDLKEALKKNDLVAIYKI